MKLKTKQAWTGGIFSLPALIGVILFYLVPYVISIYYSFTSYGRFVGFDNYAALIKSGTFWLSVKNTAIFSLFAIPLSVIISFLIALFLSTFDRHTSFFSSLFLSPMIVPIASVIYVWQIFFDDFGVINGLLQNLGMEPVQFFKGSWAMAMIVILFIWKNCAYNIILFSAGLRKIPKEAKESARLDGAGRLRVTTRIIVPLMSPTTFFVILLTFISSFKVYREVYLLYGMYPNENVYMIQHFMNNNFKNLNYPRLSASSVLLSIVIVAIMLVFFFLERRSTE